MTIGIKRTAEREARKFYVLDNYKKKTRAKIASELGISVRTVGMYMHELGITTERRPARKSVHATHEAAICWDCAKATDYRKCHWSLGELPESAELQGGSVVRCGDFIYG